jgi:hypothetical protein
MNYDKISFANEAITFNRFTIKDEKSNDLIIDGIIDKRIFQTRLNLTVIADKATEPRRKDNDLFYGEMYLDNNLTITGDLNSPSVEGNIKVNSISLRLSHNLIHLSQIVKALLSLSIKTTQHFYYNCSR